MSSIQPGETLVMPGDVELRAGRKRSTVRVVNSGDRPIQVGSHAHFYEVNAALAFERPVAYGMCLDIAAGTAIRFEPGIDRTVDLVAIGGSRIVFGLSGAVEGPLDVAAP